MGKPSSKNITNATMTSMGDIQIRRMNVNSL